MRARRHAGQRRHVLARQLDEIGPHGVALQRHAGDIAGGILDADDVLQLIQPRHRVNRHIDHRARRNIVDDNGNANRIIDRLEMLIQAFLRRPVVIGCHHQHAIGPGLFSMHGQFNRLARVVGSRPGNYRHAACRRLDAQFHDALVLVMRKRRAFAGRAHRHQPMRALRDLPFHQCGKRVFIDRAFPERRHQCRHRPPEAFATL